MGLGLCLGYITKNTGVGLERMEGDRKGGWEAWMEDNGGGHRGESQAAELLMGFHRGSRSTHRAQLGFWAHHFVAASMNAGRQKHTVPYCGYWSTLTLFGTTTERHILLFQKCFSTSISFIYCHYTLLMLWDKEDYRLHLQKHDLIILVQIWSLHGLKSKVSFW